MSVTFANIAVRSGDQQAVAAAVRRLPRRLGAFVAPPVNKWVMVFDEASDAPDEDRLSGYTVMLSGTLRTKALGFLVYESDVLLCTMADEGRLLGQYSSWPDYFDETMPEEDFNALAGDPPTLARLGNASPVAIAEVLEREHDFAEEKLAELVKTLGLPPNAARWGYSDIEDPEEEAQEGRDAFIEVPAAFPVVLEP